MTTEFLSKGESLIKSHCIAITGGIACGKSTISRLIADQGYHIFDADFFARKAVEKGSQGLKKLSDTFGKHIILENGELDRARLRAQIMKNPEDKKVLEGITHPEIWRLFRLEASQLQTSKVFFYEAALVFEAKIEQRFHSIWSAWCPENIQIERLIQRDHLSKKDAHLHLKRQLPSDKKRDRADVFFDTNCELDILKIKICKALDLIKLHTKKGCDE